MEGAKSFYEVYWGTIIFGLPVSGAPDQGDLVVALDVVFFECGRGAEGFLHRSSPPLFKRTVNRSGKNLSHPTT